MRVEILSEKCIGCGKCVYFCPEGIVMEDGIAVIKDSKALCITKAADACPLNIIRIEGRDNGDVIDENFNRLGSAKKLGKNRLGSGKGVGLGLGRKNGRGCRNK